MEEQKSLLGALLFVSDADEIPDTVAKAEALELIRADDRIVSRFAALLLGAQTQTAQQARPIANKVVSLMDVDAATDTKVNVTTVLYQLAESYPNSVDEFVPDIAPLLDGPSAQVQENVVELLGVLERVEYRSEIAAIREETDDPSVEEAATTVLKRLLGDGPSETETESSVSDDIVDSGSVLAEIEEEFDVL